MNNLKLHFKVHVVKIQKTIGITDVLLNLLQMLLTKQLAECSCGTYVIYWWEWVVHSQSTAVVV